MFNIDFGGLITICLPSFLRKAKFFAWLKSLCFPVLKLYDEFLIKRAADLYNIRHDSRVFSLEAVLNDRFDVDARRIYITDGFTKDRTYIYTKLEVKPLFLGSVPLYNNGDYADTGVDFIVWIPNIITINTQDLIELNALVKAYKLAGKRFKVYRIAI
jgi:hypothetical protein